ncbi:MAG: transporter substrate-binding domain-containing protein [Desulfobacterales bacterium]|nr:transporter substrate-binding domain-containing protein [Desulfobacterales bacterium]MBF0395873.1 transporter substrate-binding domain-containing protein [Desulfobacterales bacterium]
MKKIAIIAIIGLILISGKAKGEQITLASDIWCPFNCAPDSSEQGYMVEIAKTVFKKSGHDVKYILMPFARAIKESREGKVTALIGVYKEDVPDFIFPKNELGMLGFSIFTTKENNWVYNGISSLEKVSLGVIRDYTYNSELVDYINKNASNSKKIQVIHGENPVDINIKKLLAGRLDATIETEQVFLYNAMKLGVIDKIKSSGVAVEPKEAYIAFSPTVKESKVYAEILSNGIDELRKSGELSKILNKYGLKDWR